jgi:formate dehydrogenase maturation protein FdhE
LRNASLKKEILVSEVIKEIQALQAKMVRLEARAKTEPPAQRAKWESRALVVKKAIQELTEKMEPSEKMAYLESVESVESEVKKVRPALTAKTAHQDLPGTTVAMAIKAIQEKEANLDSTARTVPSASPAKKV